MEDDLNVEENGRRPPLFDKMEDDLNIQVNGRQSALFGKMEDKLNFKVNGRRPRFVGKWETTSICWQLEYDFHFCKCKTTIIC